MSTLSFHLLPNPDSVNRLDLHLRLRRTKDTLTRKVFLVILQRPKETKLLEANSVK